MKVEQRLKEMGYELPKLPVPGGAYVPAKRVGNLVYVAGQTTDIDGRPAVVGVLNEDLTMEECRRGARICALNILSALKGELGDLDRVKQFVQIISFVRCASGTGNYPGVVDAASELFYELYGDAGLTARMAIGTHELPRGSSVEIMAVAEVKGE